MTFLSSLPPLVRNLPPRTICLTFHDVVPVRTKSSLWFDCSVDELKDELSWLSIHGSHFISVPQLYAHLTQSAPLPIHPVCITFADNYLGFFNYALPILRARGIPCAMFVHTGYVGVPVGRPKMDWEQLKELDRSGTVWVESQTVTHPADLRLLPTGRIKKEMVDSRVALENHLGHPPKFVAYPNGKFDRRCEAAAKSAGYLMGFSEVLTPAEASPNIFAIARYVHTKFKRAWSDANSQRNSG